MAFSSVSSSSTFNCPPPPRPPPLPCFTPPSLSFARSSHITLPRYKLPHGLSRFHHSSAGCFAASTLLPRSKAPRRKPELTSSSAAATPPCTECGKRFSSCKALFGHMRCHPERQWRGINPPPHLRRPPPPDQCFTSEEHEVASILLLLSRGTPRDATPLSAMDALGSNCKRNKVCSKGFSSDQALGGHNRNHREKDHQELEEPAPDCSSTRSYILDLNLPPPPPPPPPPESTDDRSPNAILDLRLGI